MNAHPPVQTHGFYAPDRVPGDRFRALVALLQERTPYPTERALTRELCAQMERRGARFHWNSARRFLRGTVATVPRIAEIAVEDLLEARARIPRATLDEHLATTKTVKSSDARAPLHIPTKRIAPLIALWFHFHPGASTATLADLLRANARHPRVAAYARASLRKILRGVSTRTSPDLLDALLDVLAEQGIASETDARARWESLASAIARERRGAESVPARPYAALARAWQTERGAAHLSTLARAVIAQLAETGRTISLERVTAVLVGRASYLPRAVAETIGATVHAQCPNLPADPAQLREDPRRHARAEHLRWMYGEPFVALVRAWCAAHPESSTSELARRVTVTAARWGYSPPTDAAALTSPPIRTVRVFMYRALLREFHPGWEREPIPAAFLVDSPHTAGREAPEDRARRLAPDIMYVEYCAQCGLRKIPDDGFIRLIAARLERMYGIPRATAALRLHALFNAGNREQMRSVQAPTPHRASPPRFPRTRSEEMEDRVMPPRSTALTDDAEDIRDVLRRTR